MSVLAPSAWVLASFAELPGVPTPRVEFVFALWMFSLVVVARIAERRRRSEHVERSR